MFTNDFRREKNRDLLSQIQHVRTSKERRKGGRDWEKSQETQNCPEQTDSAGRTPRPKPMTEAGKKDWGPACVKDRFGTIFV